MDKGTESEVKRLDQRIDGVVEDFENSEARLAETNEKLSKLDKSVTKVWHIGVGVALGTLIDKLGIEKILTKLF